MSRLAELEFEEHDQVPVARVIGEIDTSNAGDIAVELWAAVSNAGFGLVVDLSQTTYLDSAGVNLFFDLSERLENRQQRLRLVVPRGSRIRRVLEIVNLGSVAPIDTRVEEAVAQVARAAGRANEP